MGLETVVCFSNVDLDQWLAELSTLLRTGVKTRSKSIKARQAAAAAVGYNIRD